MSRNALLAVALSLCALGLLGRAVVASTRRGGGDAAMPAAPQAQADAAWLEQGGPVPRGAGVAPQARAPASASGPAVREACGEDQLPEFAMPSTDGDGAPPAGLPVEVRPGGVGYAGAGQRIDAALRATAGAYGQAVADALNVGGLRDPVARMEALVQAATASDDPRVYALAMAACVPVRYADWVGLPDPPVAAGCARLDARQWARRDPGNGVPWLFALQRADETGDGAAARDALAHLESAGTFRGGAGEAPALVAGLALPDDADLGPQVRFARQAMALAPRPPYQALAGRCKDDAGLAAACDRIAGTVFDHSDSSLSRRVAGSIHKLATGDASWLDEIRREARARAGEVGGPAAGAGCATERFALRRLVQQGRGGGAGPTRAELAASGVRLQ